MSVPVMLVSRDGLFSNIFTANLLAHLFNLIFHRYDNEEQGIMRPRRVKLVAIPFYCSNEMVERVKTKFVPVNHDSAEVEFFHILPLILDWLRKACTQPT